MELKEFLVKNGIKHTEVDGKINVGGYLYLENTGITSLPEGLTVGGSLYPPTEELKIPDSIGVGIKTDRWNVELKNGILTTGCQSHRIKKWRSMTDDDLRNLDSGAINFCRSHRAIIESFISKYPDQCVEK